MFDQFEHRKEMEKVKAKINDHSVVDGGFVAVQVLVVGEVKASSLVPDGGTQVATDPLVLLLHAHLGFYFGREHSAFRSLLDFKMFCYDMVCLLSWM